MVSERKSSDGVEWKNDPLSYTLNYDSRGEAPQAEQKRQSICNFLSCS